MSSVYQVSTAHVSAPRPRVTQSSAGRKPERRATRKHGRRFEDQAASILQSHAVRQKNHRRSVVLFYLLFGLLAGFFLGIAGAKGVLANTVAEPAHGFAPTQQVTYLDVRSDLNPAQPDNSALRDRKHQQRYASMLPFGPSQAGLMIIEQRTGAVLSGDRVLANKHLFLTLLTLILVVTVSLTGIFWRHLSRAYSPARRVRLDWHSHK